MKIKIKTKKGRRSKFPSVWKKEKNGITEGRRRAEQTGGENIGIGGSSDWRTCAVADVPMNAGAGAVGRGLDTTRSLFLLSLSACLREGSGGGNKRRERSVGRDSVVQFRKR